MGRMLRWPLTSQTPRNLVCSCGSYEPSRYPAQTLGLHSHGGFTGSTVNAKEVMPKPVYMNSFLRAMLLSIPGHDSKHGSRLLSVKARLHVPPDANPRYATETQKAVHARGTKKQVNQSYNLEDLSSASPFFAAFAMFAVFALLSFAEFAMSLKAFGSVRNASSPEKRLCSASKRERL